MHCVAISCFLLFDYSLLVYLPYLQQNYQNQKKKRKNRIRRKFYFFPVPILTFRKCATFVNSIFGLFFKKFFLLFSFIFHLYVHEIYYPVGLCLYSMAVFLLNVCKFNSCGRTFASLSELIRHIEEIHLGMRNILYFFLIMKV